MTLNQMAVAASAELKWLHNAAGILGRKLRVTEADARWWGMLKNLTDSLDIPLQKAAGLATKLLARTSGGRMQSLQQDGSHIAAITIDMDRFHSVFLGNLSCSLNLHTPKRRGRRSLRGNPLESARAYGIDVSLLESGLRRSPDERLRMLDENLAFINALRISK